MARMRVFMVFVLAITAGGALAFGTYNFMQRSPATRTVSIPTKPVVVAATDLDIGAELRREDVRIIDWPANAVPAGAISDPKDVIGRGIVLPVIQNEPILPLKLSSKEAGAGLPPAIPPGLRAVSVKVNEVIGVAGYVLPGTRVDVVATVTPQGTQNATVTSKVVLTNVQVLAAGTKIERDTERNKPMPVSVVTLLVDPEEAERLTLASTEGKIQLALRNPLDKTTPLTHGIRPAELLGYGAPVKTAANRSKLSSVTAMHTNAAATSAPPPVVSVPELPSVEIIRGDKRTHETVRQE